MSNLRDYLEVPQLTKVADWLMEKQGVHNQIHEPYIYKYDKIDSEMIEQWIKDFKQGMIDTVLMGDYKKEKKMNRVELEMQRLRESTGENYMLNKMVSTDGVKFFTEYTLYKDYDKYFGLTLDGETIDVVDIMEEEFAEFLSHYRLSTIYPQVKAVHEDTWDITPEENEGIKKQMESGKTDGFAPVYDKNDIEKQLVVDSKYNMSTDSFSESHLKGPEMWTETPTNTGKGCEESWTETSTNTGKRCSVPSTFGIDAEQLKGIPMELNLRGVQSGYILIKDPTIKNVGESPIKNIEDESRAELISKVVADVMEELLTKGACSINITLKQDQLVKPILSVTGYGFVDDYEFTI